MLHHRIVELRKSKKRTQEELAEKIGVTRSALSQYEIGTRNPDYETLMKIAEYFGVSTDYLLGKESAISSIELPVDFSDPAIFNKKFIYNGKEVNGKEKDIAIRTVREILRDPEDQ